MLNFLYRTKTGRILLKPLINKPISGLSGKLMDSRFSKSFIKSFVKNNSINTDDYIIDDIKSFNEFFCRRIKEGKRPISKDPSDFIAPCDGLLTVIKIDKGTVIHAKQSAFTVEGMLKDSTLAAEYYGGYCLVYRLCVNHYHRYIYFDSGKKHKNRHIDGKYHTVRPIALGEYPVFTENCREYAVIETENFGRCVQMEIGAMLVGRIVNDHIGECDVTRGREKGHFEYGGSTVIVLIPEGKADINNKYFSDEEVPVVMGEIIGKKTT